MGYALTTGVDTSTTFPDMWLLPDLLWGKVAVLPRGQAKPPNIQITAHLAHRYSITHCLAGQSQVLTIFFCSRGRNSTVQLLTSQKIHMYSKCTYI